MGSINPIKRNPEISPAASGSLKSKEVSKSAVTAAKINEIVEMPVVKQKGLKGREVSHLKIASDLSKQIRKEWNSLYPEELAEKIIELEDRVSELKGTSQGLEKIKREAEKLHFQFVFPVVMELDPSSSQSMPPSFARIVSLAAKEVLQSGSIAPFSQFNSIQQREVLQLLQGRN